MEGQEIWFDDLHMREQHHQIRGLFHALTLMNQGFRPLLRGFDTSEQQLSAEFIARRKAFSSSLSILRESIALDEHEPAQAQEIIKQLSSIEAALENHELGLIDTTFTRRVIKVGSGGLYNQGWSYFFSELFTESVDLTKSLTWICEKIDRMY